MYGPRHAANDASGRHDKPREDFCLRNGDGRLVRALSCTMDTGRKSCMYGANLRVRKMHAVRASYSRRGHTQSTSLRLSPVLTEEGRLGLARAPVNTEADSTGPQCGRQ